MNDSVISQRKTEAVPVEIKGTSGFEGEDEDEEDAGIPIVKRTENNKAWLALHGQAPDKEFYSMVEGRPTSNNVETTEGAGRLFHSMNMQGRQTTNVDDQSRISSLDLGNHHRTKDDLLYGGDINRSYNIGGVQEIPEEDEPTESGAK